MNFKTKVKIAILCVLAISLCALCAGCIGEMSAFDYLNTQNANQCVTYYANGGRFGEFGSKDTVNMYYKEGADIISDDFIASTNNPDYHLLRPGYTFLGWYAAKTDADGNPEYLYLDKNGNPVDADSDEVAVKQLQITSTPADLSPIAKDEHRYFCAMWAQNEFLLVKLVSDEAVTLSKPVTVNGETFEAGHIFNSGDYIGSAIFTTSSTVILSGISVAECTGHTFLQYYLDEECIVPIDRYTRGEDEEAGENSVIYAKYITGKYTIVSSARGVADMLNNSAGGGSYYFFNSDPSVNEIDMSGTTVSLKSGEFNIKIVGNGFIIKNLTYNSGRTLITAGSQYSMLGKITSEANISGLTLQNIVMNVEVRPTATNASFYAITREVEQGATLENFVIDGVTLNLTVPASIDLNNIPKTEDGYETGNWLFGCEEKSDEAFLQRFTGVSVNGATIN